MAVVLMYLALAATGWSQRQLQDNIWLESRWNTGTNLVDNSTGYGIAVDFSNRCYMTFGNVVRVFDATGTVITNLSVTSPRDIEFDPVSNQVIVCSATTSNQIRIYDMEFNLLAQWGTNSLASPYGVALGGDGLIYIADTGNRRIQVFDRQGNFVRQWGQSGSAGGEFNGLYDVAVGPDSTVCAADFSNTRVQRFKATGEFIGQFQGGGYYNWNPKKLAVSADGLVCVVDSGASPLAFVLSPELGQLFNFSPGSLAHGLCYSPGGQQLYVLTGTEIRVYRRGYRTFGTIPPNAVPLPVMLNCAQRTGTTWVDIDFSVIDPDNTNVTAAAVAFLSGRTDLGALIKMTTFTNDTTVVLPGTLTTGVPYHLTWDAGADFPTNFFYLKINVLAKDNRSLMDCHFLTLPPDDTYGNSLVISRSPFLQSDFLGVWVWLVASDNPNIAFSAGGNIYGTGGDAGKLYAETIGTNTLTTADGRGFLFSLLNVREATTGEVYRAKIGTTGRVTQWDPRTQIGGLPQKINEFGFDTGLFSTNLTLTVTNAWWVVPLP